jgi:hypothetical protein
VDPTRRATGSAGLDHGTSASCVVAERVMQFLNRGHLDEQDLVLLPPAKYAPDSSSCVISGQLATGEGITYVQNLGDGAIRAVFIANSSWVRLFCGGHFPA